MIQYRSRKNILFFLKVKQAYSAVIKPENTPQNIIICKHYGIPLQMKVSLTAILFIHATYFKTVNIKQLLSKLCIEYRYQTRGELTTENNTMQMQIPKQIQQIGV